MNPRARIALGAAGVAVLAVVLVAILQNKPQSSGSPNAQPTLTANCLKGDKKVATPSWYPSDLPMPKGSYAIDVPEAAGGLRRVVFAARGSLREFVGHALGEWKKQGWTLGRGESEPGEAEDNFLKGDRYGIFRAQSVFCDPNRTWVLMVLNDPTVKTAPTPSYNTRTTGSPSPLSTR